jgi:hypothetical protein
MFPVTLVSIKEKSISTYYVKAEKEKVQAKKELVHLKQHPVHRFIETMKNVISRLTVQLK